MYKKSKMGLSMLLATALVTTPFIIAPESAHAIRSVSIKAGNTAIDESAKYTIDFRLEEELDRTDEIDIKFDKQFDISSRDISESRVKVNCSKPRSVDVRSNVITIEVDERIKSGKVTVEITKGITNPTKTGTYSVSVKTTEEPSYEEGTIKITKSDDKKGSSGSKNDFKVKWGSTSPDTKTSLELGKIKLDDDLEEGEIVTVTFPDRNMLPSKMSDDDVEINGRSVDDVYISGSKVELTVPRKANGDSDLTIVFDKNSGIRTPSKTGKYTIDVKYDRTSYESDQFEIKSGSSSSSSDFSVVLSDKAANARSSYTLDVNLERELTADTEFEVEFPSSDMLPSFISPQSVTINGVTSRNVNIYNNKVYVTTPYGFSRDDRVKIVFHDSAFIKNPMTQGSYTLKAKIAGDNYTSAKFDISGSVFVPTNPVPTDNSQATITLTKPGVSSATGVNIGINSLGVGMVRDRDFFEVVLPAGFTIPASIAPSSVTVNGLAATLVTSRGQNLVIYPSQDLFANAPVTISINETAKITTPAAKNAYTISVYTSAEKASLFSRQVSVGGAPVQPTIPATAAHLRVNVASFTKSGQTAPLTVAPYTVNGNTLVPAQFFRDGLGLSTQWTANTATISSGSTVITFTVGSDNAKVGNTTVKLPVAVQAKNGMPMLPIRFVADTLKYTIGWDGATSSIAIFK